MTAGPGCTVYVDGVRLADGAPGDPETAPTALSGLTVSWGRDTTVDQPAASTCTFEIVDAIGGESFAQMLRTGVPITVAAGGTVYPDPTMSTFLDPGFSAGRTDTVVAVGGTVEVSTRRASSGAQSLHLQPADASRRATAVLAPAPFVPVGTSPDAWAAIPATASGQTWAYGATVFAPYGATVQLRPVLFSAPWANRYTVVDEPIRITGNGQWHTVTADFTPDATGAWVGVQVSTFPTGWQWDEVPADLTWDALAAAVDGTRTNLADDPHAGGAGRWKYQTGTGGAVTTSTETGTDTPDGRPGYFRATIATPDTAGNAGIYYRQESGVPGVAGDVVTMSMYFRTSEPAPLERRLSAALRMDGVQVSGPVTTFVTPVTDEWVRVSATITATAPFNGVQLWVSEAAPGPVDGVTLDATQTLLEYTDELRVYFDGDTPDTGTTSYDWTAGAGASSSTATTTAGWGWTWDDLAAVYVDDVEVLAPAGGVAQSVLVFSGRVTALEESWDDGLGAPVIQVTCADFTADLDNRDVGDEPWAVERLADRMTRVIALSGLPVPIDVAPTVADILVSWKDVDAQPAMGVLAALAASVDGILWSATHAVSGPYLELEDPSARLAFAVLVVVDDVVVIVPADDVPDALELSACDVLRDDVTWTQDTQDVSTRAAVSWKEQGVDDEGKVTTTDRTVTVVNPNLEARLGSRRISLSTELQSSIDATNVASKLLARTSAVDWRADGLVVDVAQLDDVDAGDVATLFALLDGTTRNGAPLHLVDVPAWAPAPSAAGLYLEGGDYSFEGGEWVLSLTVSNATNQGQSVAWNQLDPVWTWDQFDPAISWNDLRGVGMPPEGA